MFRQQKEPVEPRVKRSPETGRHDNPGLPANNHLLFDDHFISRRDGFKPTLNPASKTGAPVLLPDRTWEAGGICGDSNMSVIDNNGEYLMWYAVKNQERAAPGSLPAALKKLDAKTRADYLSRAEYLLCHATSSNGMEWHKPELGIFTCRGGKKNNIVFSGRLGATVFKDPNARQDKRYKMIYGGGPRLPHLSREEYIPDASIYHAVYGAYSPDGIRWTPYQEPIVPWYTDTTNVCYWDDRLARYVAYLRWNENMTYRDGKTCSGEWRLMWRAIGRTESADFQKFPAPVKILEPAPDERPLSFEGMNVPEDSAPDQPETVGKGGLDYYNSSAVKYPFAANSYFMFISFFYHAPGTLEIHLATSRDGVHYRVWDEPFVHPGLEGSFDSRCAYMATGMIRQKDRLYMYYNGYDTPHGQPGTGNVGMLKIRPDGFVSQDVDRAGGELTTEPVPVTGKKLLVNMNAGAGGSLKAELLESGKPIPGFSAGEADWLWGNNLGATASWNGQSDLAKLAGKKVAIRFQGSRVRLYSFRFV